MIESVATKCSLKEVFSKFFEISQENTGDRVFFLIKLQSPESNFNKKETQAHLFFCEFY